MIGLARIPTTESSSSLILLLGGGLPAAACFCLVICACAMRSRMSVGLPFLVSTSLCRFVRICARSLTVSWVSIPGFDGIDSQEAVMFRRVESDLSDMDWIISLSLPLLCLPCLSLMSSSYSEIDVDGFSEWIDDFALLFCFISTSFVASPSSQIFVRWWGICSCSLFFRWLALEQRNLNRAISTHKTEGWAIRTYYHPHVSCFLPWNFQALQLFFSSN